MRDSWVVRNKTDCLDLLCFFTTARGPPVEIDQVGTQIDQVGAGSPPTGVLFVYNGEHQLVARHGGAATAAV
jgi:hypothetical protein